MKQLLIIIILALSFKAYAQDKTGRPLKKQYLSEVAGLKDKPRPLIIIDDAEYKGEIDSIDLDKIATMNVIKNVKDAKEIYGEAAANGAIVIYTKQSQIPPDNVTLPSLPSGVPLYILDGKKVSADALQPIDPNDVMQVEVLKKAAIVTYGEAGKNGVIIITTKAYATEQLTNRLGNFSPLYAAFIKQSQTTPVSYFLNGRELKDIYEIYNIKAEQIDKVNFDNSQVQPKLYITTKN